MKKLKWWQILLLIWFYPAGIAYLIYRIFKYLSGNRRSTSYTADASAANVPPINNGYQVNNGYPGNGGSRPNTVNQPNNGYTVNKGSATVSTSPKPVQPPKPRTNTANTPTAYSGSEPYIFISYAHADSDTVVPIINNLKANGFRVWYDVGIEAGTEWPQYIAEHLDAADCVIAFISDSSVASHNCRREINFAIELKKEMLVIYLEETELPLGMRLQLNTLQAMFKYRCEDEASFYDELFKAKLIENCHGEVQEVRHEEQPTGVKIPLVNNDATVMYNMGISLYEGKLCKVDYDKAFGYFRRAAELGHIDAQNYVGICYEKGHGTVQNAEQAVVWYRKAVAMNNMYAQNNLGSCYERGFGVPQDFTTAAKWYKMSAEQGYMFAQHNIGYMYDTGRGVEQDFKTAFAWYEKAASQGYAASQNNLGVCYQNGRGVEKNEVKAVEWYRKAAQQNFALAQSNLGICYQNGIGVEQNNSLAMQWLERAAQNGGQN